MPTILAIEDDPEWMAFLKKAVGRDHEVRFWSNSEPISTVLQKKHFEIIILSLQVKGIGSFNLLKRIRFTNPHTPVLAISSVEKPSLIVKALKGGAFDFVPKPFTKEKILLAITRALENRLLKNEIDYLRHEQDVLYDFNQIIAESPAMRDTIATLKKFSKTDSTILVTGETGTGKSFLSGAVHFNSRRKKRPFIKINCANIPESLMESELFGHEKGAFTSANKTRVGRLEQAKGGTVFLDEIGELSLALQAKLLRVLEEKSFERVGGNKTIYSDVRIIAATNRKPEEQVANGSLRGDLYYRLNILRVHLPPLRERRECIVPLAQHLLADISRMLRLTGIIRGFTRETLRRLKSYAWPGNIRQLANTIERAVILEETELIRPENIMLPDPFSYKQPDNPPIEPVQRSLVSQEKEMIIQALEESLWVQKDAAALLGISPRAMNYKIKRLGITHPRWRKNV
jgi:DNA-binding NtrC family response regulator